MAKTLTRQDDRKQAGDSLKAALARQPVIAAVDLGASKVACFVMKPDGVRRSDRTLTTAGVGYVQSRGVKGATISSMDEAAEAIALAVERAESVAGVSVQGVTIATAGGQMRSDRVSARVSIGARPISDNDCSRALAAALDQIRLPGRRPLHILPIAWSVDSQKGVRDPRAMFGKTLGVELLVVSVAETVFNTLGACVERAHLQLEGVVAAPFVSALAALQEDEMDLGSVCIDMGGGSTSASVFRGGSLVHVETVPVGGQHITNDIARGLSTTISHAERMKTLWGSALASTVDEREMISVPLLGERGVDTVQQVPKSMLTGIIRPRLEETFELLRYRLESSGQAHLGGRRLVITGGASQLNGVREVAGQWLDRHVRMGSPAHVQGMPESAHSPGFSVCAGLLNYALKPDVHYELPKHKVQQVERARQGYVSRVGRWIAESF